MKIPSLNKIRTDYLKPEHLEKWVHDVASHLKSRTVDVLKRPKTQAYLVEPPNVQLINSFRTFSKWSSIIAIAIGYHVLLGWMFDNSILKALLPISSP